jgi:hypothetical protein
MLLSEEDAMNKLNPYVVFDFSLPGSVRQTPEFSDHGKEVHGTRDVERGSPICDVASTSGDRTIDFCKGGREPPCPLNRPVYPRRRVDTCAGEKEEKRRPVSRTKNKNKGDHWMLIAGVFALIVLIIVLRA